MTTGTKRRTTFVTQPPAEQAICRKCGAHEDANTDGLCQQCLAERVNGAGILEDDSDDDIFDQRIQRTCVDCGASFFTSSKRAYCMTCGLRRMGVSSNTTMITCAVCGLTSRILIAEPGDICGPCRTDLVMTRQHVEMTLETARSRLRVLMSNFEAAVARESEKDQARWANVVAARVKVQAGAISAASFRSRWAEALAAGDGLSWILAAHEAYERGCQEVEQVETWATKAGQEIEVAS